MTIKEKRIEIGYTQQKLADVTGIQVRVLQRIERENNCSLINAMKLSKALDEPIEELFKKLYENA